MNDSIKKMLRLIDQNLVITEVSYELFQNKKTVENYNKTVHL